MAKAPEFKKPEGVTVKQPIAGNLFGDEPTVPPPVSPEIEWSDIPNVVYPERYPFTGEPVWLTPDGETEYIGVWRQTREFRDGRFRPTEFWARHNGGGLRIGFDPIGYRKYEPPIYVPEKRA